MKKITVSPAKYRKLVLENQRDNPLICALPEKLSPGRLRKALTKMPIALDLKQLTKRERISAAKQVKRILVPTSPFMDFYHAVYHLIESGYETRNPLDPEVVAWSYDVADPEISIQELRERHQLTQYDGETTSEHLFFVGLSGLGKSMVKNCVMAIAFPNVILHSRDDFDEIQIVHLHVEMPHDGTRGTLLKNFFRAFDKTLKEVEKTNYLKMAQPSLSRSASIGSMESFMQDLCIKYHVGVVIIDEFQNLNVASRPDFDQMRQLFDSMSNDLNVPFVKIGTTESLRPFEKRFRHGRRAGETLELLPYERSPRVATIPGNSGEPKMEGRAPAGPAKSNRGRDWDNLLKALFSFQVIERPIDSSPRWDEELYRLSCGIPYVLFTLWQEAQIDAIRSGKETLTLCRLKIVYNKRFKLIKSALAALRKRKIGQFQDLLTINQLIDKGENQAALKHLKKFTDEEQFSGAAAVQILEVVQDLEKTSDLKPKEQVLLDKVKVNLKQRSQPILKGQTIDHEHT